MAVSTITSNGIFCYLIDGESTYTLPDSINASEPMMIRNVGSDAVTINCLSGQTINGASSLVMEHEHCMFVSPNGTDWEYIHHNTPPSTNIVGGTLTIGPGDQNNLDVGEVFVIIANASHSSNYIEIKGLQNGVAGQVLHIAKTNTTGKVILHNEEGTGSQDIRTSDDQDESEISNGKYGGFTLVCDGTNWYEIDKP